MYLEVEIPEKQIEYLINEVMQNYPECSTPAFQCTGWDYDNCEYTFVDYEDGDNPRYRVDYAKLREGFEKLIMIALGREAGKRFYASGWDPSTVFNPSPEAWEDWACDWDAVVVDGLVQCAVFGEVVYG